MAVLLVIDEDFRRPPARPSVAVANDAAACSLMRRIVPHLRSRRPRTVLEAQQRWRGAVEARRRASRIS